MFLSRRNHARGIPAAPSRRRVALTTSIAGVCLAALAGCGGSKSTATPPPSTSPSALTGTYVFSANGSDPNDGLYDVAGVLTFDGKGAVTSGVADYNLGTGIDPNVPLTGSYNVTGTTALITLTDSQGLQDSFSVSLASSGASTISSFDGTGTGTLTPQGATTFTTDGTYTFSLSGFGENTFTSTGGFTVASGAFTSGTENDTDGIVVNDYAKITGILEPVQADGRGQAAIGGFTFGYYPVSPTQIILVGLDDRSLVYGTASRSATPASAFTHSL